MENADDQRNVTSQSFEQQLEQLLVDARDAGVDVEGGWNVQLESESFDWGIEITAVERSE